MIPNRIEKIERMSNSLYHNGYKAFISSTTLKKLREGGLTFLHDVSIPNEFKPQFVFGSLWHDLISSRHEKGEPMETNYAIVDFPDYMLNKGKPYGETSQAYADGYARLTAENEGKTIVFPHQYQKASSMVEAIFTPKWKHPSLNLFKAMFDKGTPEVSYFIRNFAGDVNIKIRPDLDGQNYFIDYKTTSGKLSEFGRTIVDFGYDISAAMYREGKKDYWREHYGEEIEPKMYWLVQETNPPYDWALFSADKLIEQATKKFYDLLNYFIHCRNNEYGGVADLSTDKHGVFFPELAPWQSNFNKLIQIQ